MSCFLVPEAVEDFLNFLNKHANDLLKLDGFLSCDVFSVDDDKNCPEGCETVTATYKLRSKADLDNYFEFHSAKYRAETMELFKDQIKGATRRVLTHIKGYARQDE